MLRSASTKDVLGANTDFFAAKVWGSRDRQLLIVPINGREVGSVFAVDFQPAGLAPTAATTLAKC